jgi:hypothetical protein
LFIEFESIYNKILLMKKIIRLTESQLGNLVTKVIKEQEEKITFDKCVEEIKKMGLFRNEGSSINTYSLSYVEKSAVGGKIKKEFAIGISFEPKFGGFVTISTIDLTPNPTGERTGKLHPETEYIYKIARQLGVRGRKDYGRYFYEFSLSDCGNPNPKLGSTAFLKEIVSSFESKFPEYSRV